MDRATDQRLNNGNGLEFGLGGWLETALPPASNQPANQINPLLCKPNRSAAAKGSIVVVVFEVLKSTRRMISVLSVVYVCSFLNSSAGSCLLPLPLPYNQYDDD